MSQSLQPEPVLRYLRAALGPDADGPPDAELLTRFVAERDQAAFELLVWRHAGTVLRVCRGVLRDHHAAEDVTQAAFLALARKARSIGKRNAVGAWLYKVAHRLAVRHAVRIGRKPAPTDALDHLPAVPEPEPNADVLRLLHDELARLPDKYRAPVLLCFFDGLSHADAARRLGWPVGTVAGRIARAKDWLHQRLTGRVAIPAAGITAFVAAEAAPAVGPAFVGSTARAALAFAAGTTVPEVSHTVLELAKGAIQTMTLTKLQWAAGVLVACGVLTLGGMYAAGQLPGAGSPDGGVGAGGRGGRVPTPGEGVAPEADAKPAPGRNADFAQRQRSLKNLKQIMLALHNYHDTHGKFPTDITDKTGKPLLSWRVALLPYMEQDHIAKQLKLDEAWDSEHNLKLLAQMPDVFRVGFEPKGATHTYYQRFAIASAFGADSGMGSDDGGSGFGAPGGAGEAGGAGGPVPPGVAPPGFPGTGGRGAPPAGGIPGGGTSPGSAPGLGAPPGAGGPGGFDPALPGLSGSFGLPGGGSFAGPTPQFPLRMHEITDGTSNTIGLIEAGPPVPWTKPADFTVDARKPLPKFAGPFANVRNVAAIDGIAYPLRPELDEKVLKILITHNEGQVNPPLNTLKARFAADSAEEKKALASVLKENQLLISAIEGQLKEHAALLETINGVTKELTTAEEQQEQLRAMLEALKARNKKLRDELGLRPGAAVPKLPRKE